MATMGAMEHPRKPIGLSLKVLLESFGNVVDAVDWDVRKKASCLLTKSCLIFA